MISPKLNGIIIEDEALSRRRILRLLNEDHRLKIIGVYESFESIGDDEILEQAQVLFIDINLPGINGLEIAEQVNPNQIIIFTTAYSKYAVKAFNVKATDYLVKPISREQLKASVSRALETFEMTKYYLSHKHPNYITVKSGSTLVKVLAKDIFCIKSDSNHVRIKTKDQEYLVQISLKDIHKNFDNSLFVRCHRTCVLNIDTISKIIPNGSTKLAILENKLKIPLSRTFIKEYKNQLSEYF